jgi:hypothetical protein
MAEKQPSIVKKGTYNIEKKYRNKKNKGHQLHIS